MKLIKQNNLGKKKTQFDKFHWFIKFLRKHFFLANLAIYLTN